MIAREGARVEGCASVRIGYLRVYNSWMTI
jgi:hypothetical protein